MNLPIRRARWLPSEPLVVATRLMRAVEEQLPGDPQGVREIVRGNLFLSAQLSLEVFLPSLPSSQGSGRRRGMISVVILPHSSTCVWGSSGPRCLIRPSALSRTTVCPITFVTADAEGEEAFRVLTDLGHDH